MSLEGRQRSAAWYLLPIFLSVVGGVIAFFVIRRDDPKKARACLFIGIGLTAASIAVSAVIGPGLAGDSEFPPIPLT